MSRKRPIFGRELVFCDFTNVSNFIFSCMDYIEKSVKTGLFRIPGERKGLEVMRKRLDNGEQYIDIKECKYVHNSCSLLKQFFRDFPIPLLLRLTVLFHDLKDLGLSLNNTAIERDSDDYNSDDDFSDELDEKAPKKSRKENLNEKKQEKIEFLSKELPEKLDKPSYLLLCRLMKLLHTIQSPGKLETTKMDSCNLAVCFTPNLFRSRNLKKRKTFKINLTVAQNLIIFLIENFEEIFTSKYVNMTKELTPDNFRKELEKYAATTTKKAKRSQKSKKARKQASIKPVIVEKKLELDSVDYDFGGGGGGGGGGEPNEEEEMKRFEEEEERRILRKKMSRVEQKKDRKKQRRMETEKKRKEKENARKREEREYKDLLESQKREKREKKEAKKRAKEEKKEEIRRAKEDERREKEERKEEIRRAKDDERREKEERKEELRRQKEEEIREREEIRDEKKRIQQKRADKKRKKKLKTKKNKKELEKLKKGERKKKQKDANLIGNPFASLVEPESVVENILEIQNEFKLDEIDFDTGAIRAVNNPRKKKKVSKTLKEKKPVTFQPIPKPKNKRGGGGGNPKYNFAPIQMAKMPQQKRAKPNKSLPPGRRVPRVMKMKDGKQNEMLAGLAAQKKNDMRNNKRRNKAAPAPTKKKQNTIKPSSGSTKPKKSDIKKKKQKKIDIIDNKKKIEEMQATDAKKRKEEGSLLRKNPVLFASFHSEANMDKQLGDVRNLVNNNKERHKLIMEQDEDQMEEIRKMQEKNKTFKDKKKAEKEKKKLQEKKRKDAKKKKRDERKKIRDEKKRIKEEMKLLVEKQKKLEAMELTQVSLDEEIEIEKPAKKIQKPKSIKKAAAAPSKTKLSVYMEDDWYVQKIGGDLKGPYTWLKLKTMFKTGQIRTADKVLGGDLDDLTLLSSQKQLIKYLSSKKN